MPSLKRDGVSLYFEEDDEAVDAPTLVFVHGWGCNRTFMAPLFEHFRGGYRVVVVDLRGHGRSDTPQQAYTMSAFADDIAWLCRQLDLDKPVIIGHSMGGAIGLQLAAMQPGQLAGTALLDTAVLPGPDVWAGAQPLIRALHTSSYRDAMRQFVTNGLFLPSADPVQRNGIIEAMLETPQHVLAATLEGGIAWDSQTAVNQCSDPVLYIASKHQRGDVDQFARQCPQLVRGQVDSAGHFLQMEEPDQVAAILSKFLDARFSK